jgi:hypothetical protein
MEHEIDQFAKLFIKEKARYLSRRARRVGRDEEDVAADLTLHLLRKRDQFDAERGSWTTFVKVVITNYSYDLAEQWSRESETCTMSMSDPVVYQAVLQIDDSDALRKDMRAPRSAQEQVELAADLAVTITRLTDQDQRLCRELSENGKVAAAKALGRSPSYVTRRVQKIGQTLAANNLDEYG